MTEKMILTTIEAAELFGISRHTLDIKRSQGIGPKYSKLGNLVRYLRNDLLQWFAADPQSRKLLEEEAACHALSRSKTKRMRGRAGQLQRQRRLAAEPYCRDCAADGIVRRSEEIDHIIRLCDGGTDTDDNTRALCKPCHAYRTKETRADEGA